MARRKKAKPIKPTTSILTSQPTELVAAIREQVSRAKAEAVLRGEKGPTVSEWVGNACLSQLDQDLADTVPERVTRGATPRAKPDSENPK